MLTNYAIYKSSLKLKYETEEVCYFLTFTQFKKAEWYILPWLAY